MAIDRIAIRQSTSTPISKIDSILVGDSWADVTPSATPVPTLTTTGTLSSFSTPQGTPSASQNFSVSGINLTANITVTAPANFEVSTDNSSFASSVSLAQTGGSASGTIYVRLTGATEGSFTGGSVTVASTDATSKTVAVSGSVTPASSPSISTSGTGSLTSLTAYVGYPSVAQSFTAGGINLNANIDVTPPAGFEVSTDGSNFTSLIPATIAQSGGSASGTVYVRTAASATTTNSIAGNVTLSSSGAVAVNVPVTGSVQALALALAMSPATVAESAGANASTGTVSIAGGIAAPVGGLSVNLSSSVTNTVTVPTNAIIPAGSNSVTFAASVLANGVPNTDVTATITATATSYTTATASLTVTNVDGGFILSRTAIVSGFDTTNTGVFSATNQYTVSGVLLNGPVTITAPTLFDISTNTATGWTNSLTLPITSNSLASTTVFVRMQDTAALGVVNSGNISHVSGSASINIPLEGAVLSQGGGAVTLPTGSYVQNFNGIRGGLPTGWTTRTNAIAATNATNSNLLGEHMIFSNGASTAWSDTGGRFKNFAANDGTGVDGGTNSVNRALGIRQTGTAGSGGDPGAAFTLQLANTTQKGNINLSFKAMTLSAETRSTTWLVQYGIGASPTNFVTVTNYPDPGVAALNTINVSNISALNNLSSPVWIRVAALTAASPTSGNRDSFAIDDFTLTYNDGIPPAISSISPGVGKVGDSVTITGTDLDPATVTVGGSAATVTSSTGTQLVFTVPAGLTAGEYSVVLTTAGGNTSTSFRVLAPVTAPFGPLDFATGSAPFYSFNTAGTANWGLVGSTLGGGGTNAPTNEVMQINGFNSNVPADDWLVIGPLDLSSLANPVLTFTSLTRYAFSGTTPAGVNEMTLKVSTDYDGVGSPAATGTWSNLSFIKPASDLAKQSSGQVKLVGGANQTNTYVAFHYVAGGTNTGSTAVWQIDDVKVAELVKPALTLVVPSALNEGGLGASGTVHIPEPAGAAGVTVDLSSSDTGSLTVDPVSVTIAEGQTSASFSIDTSRDYTVDADGNVTITASLADSSYDPADGVIRVVNIDLPDTSLGGSGYTQTFSSLTTNAPSLPLGWSVSGSVTNWATGANGVWDNINASAGLLASAAGGILGYQHTSSTGTAGLTLTLRNTTGAAITELTVSYKGRVGRAADVGALRYPAFTVSVAGQNGAALAYATSEADGTTKTAGFTGLSIPDNTTFAITWSSDRGLTGSGSSKQIGLSDVSVTLGAPAVAPSLAGTSMDLPALAPTAATITGNVTSDGGAEVTERGFVYALTSANADPLIDGAGVTKVTDSGTGTGIFTTSLTGLTSSTSYTVKAYAVNSVGTSYGSALTFSTLQAYPSFTGTYTQDFTGFLSMANLPAGWRGLSSGGVNSYGGLWTSGSANAGFAGRDGTPGILGYGHTASTGILTNSLTLVNNTGGELTSLYVSYKGETALTSGTRFPAWLVKVNGATVAELAYSTESGLAESKLAQVTGLSIANGATFTVTWESDRDNSRTGTSRRIGLTDVRVSTSAPNSAPTDIGLTATSIAENNAVDANVGTLSTTDADTSDTHTYSLVAGTGDTDNGSFNISSNSLRASVAFDFETKNSYSIRVRTTDSASNTFEKVFTITVTNADEGTTFAGWSGGATLDAANLGKYAIGGASSLTATDGVKPATTVSGGNLVLTAIVRTDDPKLTVVGEAVASLANYSSGTSVTEVTGSATGIDQAGVPTGCEKQAFTVPQDGGRKFLRLKAVLAP